MAHFSVPLRVILGDTLWSSILVPVVELGDSSPWHVVHYELAEPLAHARVPVAGHVVDGLVFYYYLVNKIKVMSKTGIIWLRTIQLSPFHFFRRLCILGK